MNMQEVKQSLRQSALEILKKRLDTDMLESLSDLATTDGFSSITLGELMEGYERGPKEFTAKDLQRKTAGGVRNMVLRYIQRHTHTTIPEVSRSLNLETTQVIYAFKLLEASYKIEKTGKVGKKHTYQAL